MKIHLVNFATRSHYGSQKRSSTSALKHGVDSVISYKKSDLFGTEFYKRNKKIFNKVLENIRTAYKVREEGNYPCGLFASYINFDDEQKEKMDKVVADIIPYLDEVYSLPLYNQPSTKSEKSGDKENWDFGTAYTGTVQDGYFELVQVGAYSFIKQKIPLVL